MRRTESLDARLYQAALYLYPPAFRQEYSGEIMRVFVEARVETQLARPRGNLWAFRARMGADLVTAIVRQWLRTGWPFIASLAILFPLIAASALGRLRPRMTMLLPRGNPDADAFLLVLLVAAVILVVAATIILTLWYTHPLLNRHRAVRMPDGLKPPARSGQILHF